MATATRRRKEQVKKNAEKTRPSSAEMFARRTLAFNGKIISTTDDVGFYYWLKALQNHKGHPIDCRGAHEKRWQERLARELGITNNTGEEA